MNDFPETTIFKNTETGRLLDLSTAPKEVLIKGPVYFAIHKLWKHAILGAILSVLTIGVSWLVYPVYVKKIMRAHLLAAGWVPVSTTEKDEESHFGILLVANLWALILLGLLTYISLTFIFPESL